MIEKNTDRRVRKTKTALHQALLELLEEKNFSEITIIELTEKADVNRKTFYNHYTDLNEVMDEIENDLADSFINLMSEDLLDLSPQTELTKEIYDHLTEKALKFFTTMIETFQTHPIYVKLLSAPDFQTNFHHLLVEKESKLLLDTFGPTLKDSIWLEYTLNFIMSGSMAVIKNWTCQGYPASPEAMAQFFSGIFQGAYAFEYIQRMSDPDK